jgi:NAD(P)-dependent dehydrogenase (short-subunit alcohol dehydrogenase family)
MNILLTGASSGFGKLIVAELLKAGHKVAGTVRDPQGRNAEVADLLRDLGAEIVNLDVTDDASVEAGVLAASDRLGGIDVLINNAGVGVHGLQENFSAADFLRIFDINVIGPQRMTRAVLPQMRERGDGLILNITSLLGRVTLPFYGPYNAAKWALEAMSENYRVELSQFGVDVAIIEPGGFPTEFHGNLVLPTSPDRDAGYGDMADAPAAARQQMNDFLAANPQQSPSLVADAVVAVVNAAPGTRPFRTEVDKVGMGDLVKPMNDLAEINTEALFTNFGMADMLRLNVAAKKAA